MDANSLFDKLKSMGVQVGTKNILSPSRKVENTPDSIEKVVPGDEFSTVYGKAFITRESYPSGYLHGQKPLCTDFEMDVLAAWAKTGRILQPGGENVVFLDTETSGLAGGTGTYAFLIGLGYRTEDGFKVIQFFMRDPGEEAALIAALDQTLAKFDVIVTFNGKTFDVPLLNTRYQLNGFTPPFSEFEHVDVLQIARKLWRDRLPSRALGELEKEIVQYFRTTEEVPGWMIPQLYFDYLHSGDARPLAGVFYHNAMDILSLSALYNHIASILKDPLSQEKKYGLDLAAIARLYEEMGWYGKAALLYENSLEVGDLSEEFFVKTLDRYAQLHRRQKNWESAVALWEKAADYGMVSACVELSKYYEHHARNPLEALNWARAGLKNLEQMDIYDHPSKTIERDLQSRIGRLYQRAYRDFGEK